MAEPVPMAMIVAMPSCSAKSRSFSVVNVSHLMPFGMSNSVLFMIHIGYDFGHDLTRDGKNCYSLPIIQVTFLWYFNDDTMISLIWYVGFFLCLEKFAVKLWLYQMDLIRMNLQLSCLIQEFFPF